MKNGTRTPRPRNAEATREALLQAARQLFGERGFSQTTVRDIGERADIDPALIARYFGNKLSLYLASLTADEEEVTRRLNATDARGYVDWLLGEVERKGPGPLMQAVVRTDTSPEIRLAAKAHLERRLVAPLANLFTQQGVSSAQLRAETAVAALIGVLVVRATGSLGQLQQAQRDQVADLLTSIIENLAAT